MATIDSTTNADAELAALLEEQVDREVARRIAAVVDAVDFGRPGYRRRGMRFPLVRWVWHYCESCGRRTRAGFHRATGRRWCALCADQLAPTDVAAGR